MAVIEARIKVNGVEMWLELPVVDEEEILEVFTVEEIDDLDFENISDTIRKKGFNLIVESYVIDEIDNHYFDSIELGVLNDVASKLENMDYDSYHLEAFIEWFGLKYIDEFDDYNFYNDSDDLLDNIYFDFGLSDRKFLFGTVETYMDHDKVLKDLLIDGYEAKNGVIILR